jgi:hypothetical protein
MITGIYIKKQNINKSLKILENKETNQTIVFFPMVHAGKTTYYENCRKIIDSLRSEGFTFFYENIAMDSKLDSAQTSIYNKKVRSILGYNPLNVRNNESLPKFYKKKNIILQDYNLMGITKSDINLDLHKNQIIDSIEKKYKPIILSKCDFETNDFEKYDCKSDNKKYKFAFTNEFRDPYIEGEILKRKDKKIAMIYGKMHWSFIYPTLNKNGFEIVKGKI